jgi:hypothetical protein
MDHTAHLQSWRDFLATVEVRGPIPIRFEVLQDALGVWILRSTMEVPNRDGGGAIDIVFQNRLPGPELSKRDVIVARVLQCFQHEALESVHIDGERAADPHRERWYSSLLADWRFCP